MARNMARTRTRHEGVYQRESAVRRHRGRPDIYYEIAYRDGTGRKCWERIGWASEGITAGYAHQVRLRLLHQRTTGEEGATAPAQEYTLEQAQQAYAAAVLAAPPVLAGATTEGPGLAAPTATAVPPARLHEWRDARGKLHRSNLPPQAFTADGRLQPAWDPNHPASQQAELARRLAEREQELRAQRAATTRAGLQADSPAVRDTPRTAQGRRMGLGELLELEKNAGRPVTP